MSNKLKLSEEKSSKLDFLSKKINLRRNIICRIAIGRSLIEKESVENYIHSDSQGYELNRSTIMGHQAELFRALINQHEGKKIGDFVYFSKFVRNHIERGILLLYEEFIRVNSPTEFLIGLIDYDKKENSQVNLF